MKKKSDTISILRTSNKSYREDANKFAKKFREERDANLFLRGEYIKLDAKYKLTIHREIEFSFALLKALIALSQAKPRSEKVTEAIEAIESLGLSVKDIPKGLR